MTDIADEMRAQIRDWWSEGKRTDGGPEDATRTYFHGLIDEALDADESSFKLSNDVEEMQDPCEPPCAFIHRRFTGRRVLTITWHKAP